MDDTQLRSRLTLAFQGVFDDEGIVINDAMDLIVAIEQEFGIKFTTGEVTKLRNVGDLITLIQAKAS
jgi:acyl carrier protein